MKLIISNILLLLYYLSPSWGFQQTDSTYLRSNTDANYGPRRGKFSPSSRRILEMSTWCNTSCLTEIPEDKEEDSMILSLGLSANYTVIFPVGDKIKSFTLKFNTTPELNYSAFIQKAQSTDFLLLGSYLTKDGDWVTLSLDEKILSSYKGGKTIIRFFNFANNTEEIIIGFNYERLSSEKHASIATSGTALALVFGLIPVLVCMICAMIKMARRIKELWFSPKDYWDRRRYPVLPSVYRGEVQPSNRQSRRTSDVQFEEDVYNAHNVMSTANMIMSYHSQEEQIPNLDAINSQNELNDRQVSDRTPVRIRQPDAQMLSKLAQIVESYFPETKFEQLQSSFSQATCSVCLEELAAGMDCRQLYCQHIFHSKCIELWLQNQFLKNKACCPNCNLDMRNYEV